MHIKSQKRLKSCSKDTNSHTTEKHYGIVKKLFEAQKNWPKGIKVTLNISVIRLFQFISAQFLLAVELFVRFHRKQGTFYQKFKIIN